MEDYNDIVYAFKNNQYSDKAYRVDINKIIKNNYMLSESFYSPEYERVIEKIMRGNYAQLKDLVEFKYKKEKIDSQLSVS